jgi:aspartyl-tRNA(Asn)/glutamyl-tRNA(Gln) amidotransferase subunit C
MLEKEQVEKIAKLARLGLEEKEKSKMQKDLSSILGFVEQLNKVETFDIEPMSHSVGLKNAMRPDLSQKRDKSQTEKFLALAPERQKDFYKVKQIL